MLMGMRLFLDWVGLCGINEGHSTPPYCTTYCGITETKDFHIFNGEIPLLSSPLALNKGSHELHA